MQDKTRRPKASSDGTKISHDGAILGSILSAGLGHVVVARSTVSTEAALPGLAAQGTVGFSALARQVADAASGTVVTSVGAAGEAPADNTEIPHYTL